MVNLADIQNNLKQAQLARDENKVSTLRLLLSEIRNAEIAKGQALTESDMTGVIQKEVKKRTEAAAGFRQGNREEAAQKEEAEMAILKSYLPEQLTDEELTNIVEQTITELGASSIQDMGRVIGLVMGKVSGRAEGSRVSQLVKEKLIS